MFNLFGSSNNDCPASGWTVRDTATRPKGDQERRCPAGDHEVATKNVRGGVQLGRHPR